MVELLLVVADREVVALLEVLEAFFKPFDPNLVVALDGFGLSFLVSKNFGPGSVAWRVRRSDRVALSSDRAPAPFTPAAAAIWETRASFARVRASLIIFAFGALTSKLASLARRYASCWTVSRFPEDFCFGCILETFA